MLEELERDEHLEYEGRNDLHAIDLYICESCERNLVIDDKIRFVWCYLDGFHDALKLLYRGLHV